MRVVSLLIILALTGCFPRTGVHTRVTDPVPALATIMPGQSLSLRLEDGGTATISAGLPYVSALGESCVRINRHPSLRAACLRNGEWVGLTDIFLAPPAQETMP